MSEKIKVCHFTSVHPEKDIRIFFKECISLSNSGFEVYLVCVGEKNKKENGINIIAVNNKKKSRLNRLLRLRKKIFKAALEVNADIYHFHDPELLPYGIKLRKKGKIVIYDAHEDLPRQILSKHYIPLWFRKTVSIFVEFIENYFASKISGIVAATPIIEKRFKKINDNTLSICNYPILKEFEINNNTWRNKENEICYVGSITKVRGGNEMIDALTFTNTRLNLAGNFSPYNYFNELSSKKGWEKVNYYGLVSREEIKKIFEKSMLGVIFLHPLRSYIDSLPIKLFEYMAAGLPVLASDFQLWREIIEEGPCGICINPFNNTEITNAINKIISNKEYAEFLGKNGRELIEKKYNWENEQLKLISFYKELLSS